MRKGLLLLVIALLIIFLPKTSAFAQRFPDVPPNHWAFYSIESLASKGIINGYPDGLFRPDVPISRSQIAKLVVPSKTLSLNTTFKGYFTDVPQTHWAWRYIETAKDMGLVKGFPDGTFKPEDFATRAQLVTILMRDHPSNTSGTPFIDVPPDHWAYPYIMTAKNAGIVKGYPDGTFRPDRFVTRAEAVSIIYRILCPSNKLIVIDPGHGGSDSGACANGLREKDVNLDVALRLRNLLQSQGYGVIMTRTTDIYLSLQQRCDIANNNRADIFVSVHHNAATVSTARGTEVLYYTYSSRGKKLAECIQSELIKAIGTRDHGIKPRDDLYVLKHTVMPAVITEAAFLSNPEDAGLLKQDSFRQKIAQGICNGVVKYFSVSE
ncbi:MAG: N-acetylmuramoyl-L-alanine amidase [Actinomycetota bacterium]|nr:N-acetylmuramoyl-L-alanine amidase [Actinomycetota bacterium]